MVNTTINPREAIIRARSHPDRLYGFPVVNGKFLALRNYTLRYKEL
jgi:hypothetical protein